MKKKSPFHFQAVSVGGSIDPAAGNARAQPNLFRATAPAGLAKYEDAAFTDLVIA